MASATTRISAPWSSSTAITVAVLAVISPPRDRGVAPSRLSTPYRRSNPVAMAWLVNAVDMTASAMIPGVRKSILFMPVLRFSSGSRPNATSSSSGMTSVSSSCSPLRSSVLVSSRACAAIIRGSGAAPGAGAKAGTSAMPWVTGGVPSR